LISGLESTYKELKLAIDTPSCDISFCLESTYKELKLSKNPCDGVDTPSRLESTYKELKQLFKNNEKRRQAV